jgi:branched-chain amino acid transport system substrate-binding protein
MSSRVLSTALAVALGTTLLAAGAAAQDTIKIGVTQPLTGAFAASGNYVTQGAKIAEEEINKAGGVLGKKIELIVEDNKSNPTEAVATAEKLIVKDKVPVMMGAWSSTLTLAVMPKLEEYKVPMLVETSSSGKITVSGNPYIFRISPTSEMEAKAFTPLIKSLGIKKADFLATNNDFGLGASGVLRDGQEGGVTVGVMETMDPRRPSPACQDQGVRLDTLFVTTAVEQITLILKQAWTSRCRSASSPGGSTRPIS